MRRLRIAFVVDRFGRQWGGAEAYGVALVRELSAHHDITVLARDYDPDCGLQLPYVALKTRSFWPSWVRVWLHARQVASQTRQGYDIVHSHSNGWAGDIEVVHVTPVRYRWGVQAMSRLKRIMASISPRVQTYLGLEARRLASREGHFVVAVSALIEQQLQQAYGRPVAQAVIPPGVDMPAADVDDRIRDRTRQELGLTDTDQVAILVARNPLRKGLETAMQACLQLPPAFRLLVVGSSAATRTALESMPDFHTLADRLILLPPVTDVSPYYRAADCCIHPTRNDSFGMVPLEAMAHGLPVVVSTAPWCGFAHYLTNDRDAILLDRPTDATALAQALKRLASDSSYRQRLVQGGYEQARRRSWSAIAKQYQSLYDQAERTR